jgi:hypothetical protein
MPRDHVLVATIAAKRIWSAFVLVFTVAGVIGITPSRVLAQSTLYDDFSGTDLNPDKWWGYQYQFGGGTGLELVRQIQNGALILSHRVAGGVLSDVGTHESDNEVGFQRTGIIALQFDVNVASFLATSCPTSVWSSFASARAINGLFNDGRGDVRASIEARRDSASSDPPDQLQVVAFLWHTVDGTLNFVDLGPLSTSTTATLRMTWNQAGHAVDFQMNGNPIQSVSYTRDDSLPARDPTAVLAASGFAANCTAGRQFATISATFGNVLVDP